MSRSHHNFNGPAAVSMQTSPKPPRLLDQVRQRMRTRHDAIRTEEAYVGRVCRIILFHGTRHQREMGAAEVAAFLTHLAVHEHVTASTQNQALAAILFLYQNILEIDLPRIDSVRAVLSSGEE